LIQLHRGYRKVKLMVITPGNTIFVALCFEGPDDYSVAGGLGDRINHLVNRLADMGFVVHHIFIGDPRMDGVEPRKDGKLILHRWCQWISESHRNGVYDGERWKFDDFTKSVPPFVVQNLVYPAVSAGKQVVILGEEWQTAEAMCCIHDLLHMYQLREKVKMLWNANDIYGFEQVDWEYLSRATTITVVREHMKQILLEKGVNPVVIPNGIPEVLLEEGSQANLSRIRKTVGTDVIFSKVSRWHQDRGWKAAIDAIHKLNKVGESASLLACVGVEADRKRIAHQLVSCGIGMKSIDLEMNSEKSYLGVTFEDDSTPYFEVLSMGNKKADVFNLALPVPLPFLSELYRASDVVLANSDYDPFALDMEAMAAGAIVFVSHKAEGQIKHMYNAVVLDKYTSDEILFYTTYLRMHPEKREVIQAAAKETAKQHTWKEMVKRLLLSLESHLSTQ
jgi:glycosyltransferase involved in cell wall biosynthesis